MLQVLSNSLFDARLRAESAVMVFAGTATVEFGASSSQSIAMSFVAGWFVVMQVSWVGGGALELMLTGQRALPGAEPWAT
ncbi:hypothetical protein [Nocardia sp. NPDC003979]